MSSGDSAPARRGSAPARRAAGLRHTQLNRARRGNKDSGLRAAPAIFLKKNRVKTLLRLRAGRGMRRNRLTPLHMHRLHDAARYGILYLTGGAVMGMSKTEAQHRVKILDTLRQIPHGIPAGWTKNTLAVGGLSYIGFSETAPGKLVCISGQANRSSTVKPALCSSVTFCMMKMRFSRFARRSGTSPYALREPAAVGCGSGPARASRSQPYSRTTRNRSWSMPPGSAAPSSPRANAT